MQQHSSLKVFNHIKEVQESVQLTHLHELKNQLDELYDNVSSINKLKREELPTIVTSGMVVNSEIYARLKVLPLNNILELYNLLTLDNGISQFQVIVPDGTNYEYGDLITLPVTKEPAIDYSFYEVMTHSEIRELQNNNPHDEFENLRSISQMVHLIEYEEDSEPELKDKFVYVSNEDVIVIKNIRNDIKLETNEEEEDVNDLELEDVNSLENTDLLLFE